MTPTNELRFVERWVTNEVTHDTSLVRILQQKWIDTTQVLAVLRYGENGWPVNQHPHEWRDVPVVKEQV